MAGPVVAAAVVVNNRKKIHPGIRDSKKMNAATRAELYEWIKENAKCWGIGVVEPPIIDRINILQASFLAMHRALDQLSLTPRHILVDGNRFIPYRNIQHTCMIKGDGRFYSIAAASILAKHHRDTIMINYHEQYPEYDWKSNKGYPTATHKKAIQEQGPCPLHRRSFKLMNGQMRLL